MPQAFGPFQAKRAKAQVCFSLCLGQALSALFHCYSLPVSFVPSLVPSFVFNLNRNLNDNLNSSATPEP
jgi:hypothetical protein